jgi:hypothetical protein
LIEVAARLARQAVRDYGFGDLLGALETSTPIGDSNEVLRSFGQRQIANGDCDGALKATEQMKSKLADQLFYELGDACACEVSRNSCVNWHRHMSDRILAAEFTKLVRFTLSPGEIRTVQATATPCDIAYHDASGGKFAEVDALIEQNKCSYVSFAAAQYAVDPTWRGTSAAQKRESTRFGPRTGGGH